ncbi:MAG: pyrroline-5-carboxylate reductase [Oscillospiraceae bacterium]|jgi:pyrroline-5-carboxylate reductase|nr:pyrroline-5-carboxylate reductase [Oscillospiraceae bacterium]
MKYGFIGLGNMGGAIVRGVVESGALAGNEFFAYDRHPDKLGKYPVVPCSGAAECARGADTVVLAVKPQALDALFDELEGALVPGKLAVSVAAGIPLSRYESRFPGVAFVRAMPNLNAAVRRSVTAVCGGSCASAEQLALVKRLLECVGEVFEIPEKLFGAFSAVGCASPAYAFMFADALASAGVKAGLPRASALRIAVNSVLGSMETLRESGVHPMELADRVCSPGGTTIEGLHRLRADGFESAVYDAIAAVIAKDSSLGG